MDIRGIVEGLFETGVLARNINDPMAQFGPANRQYLGATLLPEKEVPENNYTEQALRYRTVLANASTRFSPVQKKGNVLSGSMLVSLGSSDIGSELTGADYDALIRLIEQSEGTQGTVGGNVDRPTMLATAQLLQFVDLTLSRPLRELCEYDRWKMIIAGSVTRTGDDNYQEVVTYPSPTNHRQAAGGTWSNNSYDPYTDMMAKVELLRGKGYEVNRIITGQDVISILALNAKMTARAGRLSIVSGAVQNNSAGRITMDELNALVGREGLPPIERYDLQYRTQTGSGYFFDRGTMVFACTTGRDQEIDRGDSEPLVVSDTLGYMAIGRATGQSAPGRVVGIEAITSKKPPRIEGEAWQETLAVPTEPEGFAVITGIS